MDHPALEDSSKESDSIIDKQLQPLKVDVQAEKLLVQDTSYSVK